MVEVCVFKKDFEMFLDGENIEIGVNGINFSGGQKWCIMFVCVIYFCVGIFVLDDIFSVVDVYVG